MSVKRYFLGCPIWSHKDWVGEIFPPRTQAGARLARYAELFNAVEGNTTFYGLPKATTVARWCQQTPETFRFCYKFPREISHHKRLRDAGSQTRAFIATLAPLGSRLGPSYVQLPPSFGPRELPALAAFVAALPPGQYGVEVRHSEFYTDTKARAELDDMLRVRGINRVLLDTRALHSARATDPDMRAAQQQKPALPRYCVVTGQCPVLRYAGHPDIDANTGFLAEWAQQVAGWIAAGKTPYVFLHLPDDFYAPRLARRFHDLLSQHLDVGELPAWPVVAPPPGAAQMELF